MDKCTSGAQSHGIPAAHRLAASAVDIADSGDWLCVHILEASLKTIMLDAKARFWMSIQQLQLPVPKGFHCQATGLWRKAQESLCTGLTREEA